MNEALHTALRVFNSRPVGWILLIGNAAAALYLLAINQPAAACMSAFATGVLLVTVTG